jgi:predicted nucleotidyltransferase
VELGGFAADEPSREGLETLPGFPFQPNSRPGVFAARNEAAAAVYLFGSVARGEGRADSDVDVAVLYGKPVDPGLAGLKLALAGDLEERLGRRVDLVVLDNQPPDLVHRVLRDGLIVLENNRSARIRFEVTARNEYFDVLPMLRRYRRPPGVHAA